MKKIIIIALIFIAVIILVIVGIFIFSKIKETIALKNQEVLIENADGEFRAFSFNNSYKNDMDESRGDSTYYYLKSNKLFLELWGFGREDIVEKEISISPKEFLALQKDVSLWIEKYDILALAKAELESTPSETEEYATDVQGSFYIKIYYSGAEDIVLSEMPPNYHEMLADLDLIFSSYY